jgi:CHU_C Type IX secretion signal domain
MKNTILKVLFILITFASFSSCRKSRIKNKCCEAPPTQIVFTGGYITIPNVFAPDGDGLYDELITSYQGVSELQFQIKDRRGREVFSTDQQNEYWGGTADGKIKSDLFSYTLDVTTDLGEKINTDGTVCVIADNKVSCLNPKNHCFFNSTWAGGIYFFNNLTNNPIRPCD